MTEEQNSPGSASGINQAIDSAHLDQATQNLNQEQIDQLFGFTIRRNEDSENKGIRAMLDKALQSYERLPMLEIIFDRFVRILSTSLRNFTSDTVEVEIRSISSLRFGGYINSVPVPALLTVFKAVEWESPGLLTINAPLIYSLVEVLFGGRKSCSPLSVIERPYTTIEQGIVRQLSDIILSDMAAAFYPVTPVTYQFDRIETNPRFTTIARPGDPVILLQLRVEMEDRGGQIEILFPYSMFESIRSLLLQVFIGEKFGKDSEWEEALEDEVYQVPIKLEAILKPKLAHMQDIMKLKIGSTIIMEDVPENDIALQCYGTKMFTGKLGKVDNKISVCINDIVNAKLQEGLK